MLSCSSGAWRPLALLLDTMLLPSCSSMFALVLRATFPPAFATFLFCSIVLGFRCLESSVVTASARVFTAVSRLVNPSLDRLCFRRRD